MVNLIRRVMLFNFHRDVVKRMSFCTLCISTACITIVQVEAAKNMRGRVMSYLAMGYFGVLPLGSLLAGGLSQKFGASYTILGKALLRWG